MCGAELPDMPEIDDEKGDEGKAKGGKSKNDETKDSKKSR